MTVATLALKYIAYLSHFPSFDRGEGYGGHGKHCVPKKITSLRPPARAKLII